MRVHMYKFAGDGCISIDSQTKNVELGQKMFCHCLYWRVWFSTMPNLLDTTAGSRSLVFDTWKNFKVCLLTSTERFIHVC